MEVNGRLGLGLRLEWRFEDHCRGIFGQSSQKRRFSEEMIIIKNEPRVSLESQGYTQAGLRRRKKEKPVLSLGKRG